MASLYANNRITMRVKVFVAPKDLGCDRVSLDPVLLTLDRQIDDIEKEVPIACCRFKGGALENAGKLGLNQAGARPITLIGLGRPLGLPRAATGDVPPGPLPHVHSPQ